MQLLIENSTLIGKISDSVYERSIMLHSLSCPSTSVPANLNSYGSSKENASNILNASTTISKSSSSNSNNKNDITNTMLSSNQNDLMFLYDNDLQENSSFAHHAQSAGSTSLSSYCGSTTSKKEKKKRRSSSLKELMNTIQNSISKFRRRSASEKNDKTTCSIITCSSMTNSSTHNIGDVTSCSSNSRFLGDHQKLMMLGHHADTPFIGGSKNMLTTPICSSLYATPRINKRNAEESLQSTTKKFVIFLFNMLKLILLLKGNYL